MGGRCQNNHKMSELVAKRELFYQITEEFQRGIDSEIGDEKQTRAFSTRMSMAKDMGKLRTDIEQLEADIFGEHTGLIRETMAEEDLILSGAGEDNAATSIYEI